MQQQRVIDVLETTEASKNGHVGKLGVLLKIILSFTESYYILCLIVKQLPIGTSWFKKLASMLAWDAVLA